MCNPAPVDVVHSSVASGIQIRVEGLEVMLSARRPGQGLRGVVGAEEAYLKDSGESELRVCGLQKGCQQTGRKQTIANRQKAMAAVMHTIVNRQR